jgi:hypothetical protein
VVLQVGRIATTRPDKDLGASGAGNTAPIPIFYPGIDLPTTPLPIPLAQSGRRVVLSDLYMDAKEVWGPAFSY